MNLPIGIDLAVKKLFSIFIKENYDVEHTLDFETVLEDLGILCKKMGVHYEIISWK